MALVYKHLDGDNLMRDRIILGTYFIENIITSFENIM